MIEVIMKINNISFLVSFIILASLVSCTAGDVVQNETVYESGTSGESDVRPEDENVCSLVIDCSTVFDHQELLDPAVAEYLPEDGLIYYQTSVAFQPGETVAELLRRVCSENGLALETSGLSGSLYVKGIGHLYEFDCGNGSGWMYCVNGDYPNYGCGSFVISPCDVVEWKYTCDFGIDIGDTDTDSFH